MTVTIDFPSNAAVGQVHSIGTPPVSWVWDGVKWIAATAGAETSTVTLEINTGTTLPIGFRGTVMLDTSAGPITILMPLAPAAGQEILIKDATGNAGTHTVTIGGNGQLIEGMPSLAFTADYSWVRLMYSGAEWLQS